MRFDADVLIVGGGPVGLSLAVELGMRGVAVRLVERQANRGTQPRAKTLNVRSLEHFRRWGIADRVRASSPLPADLPTDIIFLTRMYGHLITSIDQAFFGGGTDERFCEGGQWIPQYVVERVLREKATSLPSVNISEGVSLLGFTQDHERVEAQLSDGVDNEIPHKSRYIVGCDGARSLVRELIGARMQGDYAYAANYNLVLRIPALGLHPPERMGIMFWTINAESPAVMGPMDEDDVWYFGTQLPPGITALSPEEIRVLVVSAIGRDVEVEILSTDPWLAHQLTATRYARGRAFLAGDACHLHPPFGGYGMNMGISDAVDLGWKLAASLQGWGGSELLDSYEGERRPIHDLTIEESVVNYKTLSGGFVLDGIEDDTPAGTAIRAAAATAILESKVREFRTLGVVLGYHYAGSPIIVSGDSVPPPPDAEYYEPDSRPGCLAPHLWMADGTSLYDHFDQNLTLLSLGGDRASIASLEDAASRLGMPMRVLQVHEPRAAALYACKLTLIRPDQHVAWSADHVDFAEAVSSLRRIAGQPAAAPLAMSS